VRLKIPTAKGMIRVGSATVRSVNHRAPSLAISGHGRTTSPPATKKYGLKLDDCIVHSD